jgi:hypothetical protein
LFSSSVLIISMTPSLFLIFFFFFGIDFNRQGSRNGRRCFNLCPVSAEFGNLRLQSWRNLLQIFASSSPSAELVISLTTFPHS